MNSNYLEQRYPREGYKNPMNVPAHYHPLSLMSKQETKEQKQDREEKEKIYSSINKLPMINVCECGEEWEDSFAMYQEGCYPYLEKTCRACSVKEDERRREQEKQAKRQHIIDGFDLSLPPRFRDKLTSVVNKELLIAKCSIIWGGFGVGKTWEAYTLAKDLVVSGEIKRWKVITEMDLILSLRDFDNQENMMNYYKNLDLLIVDETGKSNETDYNKSLLFSVLNHRYEWELKTVLICNAKTKEEIRGLMPTAILDRFRECVIEMTGQSKR